MRLSDLPAAREVHRRDTLSVRVLVLISWLPNRVSIWCLKRYLRKHKDQLDQLWYQAEDQALLNRADLQESLEQYRNGQVTVARKYVRCGHTWGTCFLRSAFQDKPHQCGEDASGSHHDHACEHCGAHP